MCDSSLRALYISVQCIVTSWFPEGTVYSNTMHCLYSSLRTLGTRCYLLLIVTRGHCTFQCNALLHRGSLRALFIPIQCIVCSSLRALGISLLLIVDSSLRELYISVQCLLHRSFLRALFIPIQCIVCSSLRALGTSLLLIVDSSLRALYISVQCIVAS